MSSSTSRKSLDRDSDRLVERVTVEEEELDNNKDVERRKSSANGKKVNGSSSKVEADGKTPEEVNKELEEELKKIKELDEEHEKARLLVLKKKDEWLDAQSRAYECLQTLY